MIVRTSSTSALAGRLLAGLSRFRAVGISGTAPHAPGLFSYCALSRERLKSVRLPHPLIGIVLSGAKEVWHGRSTDRLPAGSLFVLPAAARLDIVNEPDAGTGIYQSLILEIEPDSLPAVRLVAGSGPSALPKTCAVDLTTDLVEVTLHAAQAIAEGPASGTVRLARLTELLALLHDVPAARPLFDLSVSERVARLILSALDRDWTAACVARQLGMSESTLRRRLSAERQSFSAILRHERMQAARRLMAKGAGSGEAALAVGYASRAHFARRFRDVFGSNPTGMANGRDRSHDRTPGTPNTENLQSVRSS